MAYKPVIFYIKNNKAMLTALIKAPSLKTSGITIYTPRIQSFLLIRMYMPKCKIVYPFIPKKS